MMEYNNQKGEYKMSFHNNKKILISEKLTEQQKSIALDMALYMGFNSTSSHFPIASAYEGLEIVSSLEDLKDMYNVKIIDAPMDYLSSTKSAKKIPDFDHRNKRGLELLFDEGLFLKDTDKDLLPDFIDFKISLPENCDTSTLIAACNFAFRYGMETTSYQGRILADECYKGNLLSFEGCGDCSVDIVNENAATIIRIYGHGEELVDFSTFVCENFPLQKNSNNWRNIMQELTEAFSLNNLDGQLAFTKMYNDKFNKLQAYVEPQIENIKDKISKEFLNTEFKSYKGMKKIYENVYDIPWEVDIFEKALQDEVYPIIKENDIVEIYGALSEVKEVRDRLVAKINSELNTKKAIIKDMQLICAYKQGFSWIEEVVLPKIKNTNTSSVKIAFKAFLPDGETSWSDEDGATPSYTNVGINNPDKWFDLPIRFLQELYPIDDIIKDKLNIQTKDVEFVEYKGSEDITYLFSAYDESGNELFKDSYKVAVSERVYLDEFPEMGKAHPSTGYIKVLVNGKSVLNKRILTDLENIWDIYQSKVLPDCTNFIENKIEGQIKSKHQPFFSQLRLEVLASEPNYKLKSREDLISSLDSLHEDMYFVGSDYFKNYGNRLNGEVFDAPGLILPVIKEVNGRPSFKVTLYDQYYDKPTICIDGSSLSECCDRKDVEAYISKLAYEDGKLCVQINVEAPNIQLVKSYANLMDKQLLSICGMFKGVSKIIFCINDEQITANIVETPEIVKDLDINDIYLSEFNLIGYEQYIEIIEDLKRVKGLSVYKIGTSYQGRDIYAVEFTPNEDGYVSKTKRINYFPSEVIICRHHANEVSSTNAAFMLIKELLTNDKYKAVADKLNLVIIPVENVDGTYIHYELQKDNPNWKFHVARFNSVGNEFFREHFKETTIHKEALALRGIYRSFLPDLIVDNHGVPSHEWEQQFSGYTSPSFKGFWLPRSILYGYFWTVPNKEFKSNLILSKAIEDVVAEAIGADKEMTAWNLEWFKKFESYAHKWMPKLFPANYYKNMINYWISREHDLTQNYASHRFPWITTTYYTSEVADETAQGDYLNLCARAHLTHNLAIIDLMLKCQCIFDYNIDITNSNVSISYTRQRPIIV